ncbi:MAG TPA: hypothetical protein VFX48_02630, partial [Saprospiraceae bacterium]|nr:hypothetical protein [Saprospiraceae bacterium]
MAFDWRKTRKWLKEHLKKRFLFIVRNEETFEETASYRLTLQNIYIVGSIVVVVLGILLFLLIAFTPIKRYVPGYGDLRSQSEFIKLEQRFNQLEEELKARETYISSIRRILEGNPETSGDVTKNIQIRQEKPEPLPKVTEDSLLRAEFEASQAMESRVRPAGSAKAARPVNVNFSSSEPEGFRNLMLVAPVRGPLGAVFEPEKGHL